jgi:hypothetical protein
MPLRDLKYKPDQTILKVYGYGDNKKIKVIRMNWLRTAGVEDDEEYRAPKGSVHDSKLEKNIQRAKNNIFEYAFCNPWDWFFTGTLDPQKYDRTNLDKFHKDLTQWLRDYSKQYNVKIKFLLVPEQHSDGISWHIHGFLRGLPKEHLKQFVVGDVMGKGLAEKVKRGDVVYNWLPYAKKFGFCDLEPIRNSEAVSKYMTKYINKNLASSVKNLNAHLYYHSRGLNKAEVIKKGVMATPITPTYENEYCSVAWLDYSEELLQELSSSFLDIDYCKTMEHRLSSQCSSDVR